MRVAVFTDNDFDKVNGVTTALRAVLDRAPADISPRIYTASALAVDQPDYLALAAAGVPIPFYTEMRIYWPSWPELARRIQGDRIDLLHYRPPDRTPHCRVVPHGSGGLHRDAERLDPAGARHRVVPPLDVLAL